MEVLGLRHVAVVTEVGDVPGPQVPLRLILCPQNEPLECPPAPESDPEVALPPHEVTVSHDLHRRVSLLGREAVSGHEVSLADSEGRATTEHHRPLGQQHQQPHSRHAGSSHGSLMVVSSSYPTLWYSTASLTVLLPGTWDYHTVDGSRLTDWSELLILRP